MFYHCVDICVLPGATKENPCCTVYGYIIKELKLGGFVLTTLLVSDESSSQPKFHFAKKWYWFASRQRKKMIQSFTRKFQIESLCNDNRSVNYTEVNEVEPTISSLKTSSIHLVSLLSSFSHTLLIWFKCFPNCRSAC